MEYSRKHHYEVERELADRLRVADRESRKTLYTEVYDELFNRVPNHPMLARKRSAADQAKQVKQQLKLIYPYLSSSKSFLEIGPGDCSLSFAVSVLVKDVIAVDVSHELTNTSNAPANFQLVITDGSDVPVPEASVDIAYSEQLIEHMHPDDAATHLDEVFKALKPGGSYLCSTPNRISGPHDVSKYFDRHATCFHLKEYSCSELMSALKKAGFKQFRAIVGTRGKYFDLPVIVPLTFEKIISLLPYSIARWPGIRTLLLVRLVATKYSTQSQ